jgi:hypothetical protein
MLEKKINASTKRISLMHLFDSIRIVNYPNVNEKKNGVTVMSLF